jgi:hypothetical protein
MSAAAIAVTNSRMLDLSNHRSRVLHPLRAYVR